MNVGTDLDSGVPPPERAPIFRHRRQSRWRLEAHLEGQGDEWGVFADFSWVSLGDDNDHMSSHTASDLDVHLVEAAAVWSPGEARNRGWELFAGLRHIDLDLGIDVDPANPTFDSVTIDVSQDFSDF